MTGPRKLLAAAAISMTAACATPRPAMRTATVPTPVTSAVSTTAPPSVEVIENVAPVENLAVSAPPVEAAAPRCDEHGRPLAGNVRTKSASSMDDCSVIGQFELDWLGGPAEARMRRRRPGIDDLPWGTLAAVGLDDATARAAWTDGAFSEYASAAAFGALTTALLEAGAPVDLIAMAADFVVDEMVHVELNGRMAAELGGAAPYRVDLERVSPHRDDALPAIERAAELAVTISCIGEALSVPALAGSLRAATHPLTRAVLRRIVRDEAPHARLGWLVLDWAGDRVDRARLAGVVRRRLAAYAPLWRGEACEACAAPLGVAGLMSDDDARRTLRAAARGALDALARRGIAVDAADLV